MKAKKTLNRALCLFFLCSLCAMRSQSLHAQEFSISGYVDALHASAFHDGDFLESRARGVFELDAYGGISRAHASVKSTYDASCESRTGIELGEAWVDFSSGNAAFIVGRQIIAWGKADGITITDTLCPRDMTAFSGIDYTDSRLPVSALRVRIPCQAVSFEAVWIPVFEAMRLPDEDNPLSDVARPASMAVGATTLPLSYTTEPVPSGIDKGEYAAKIGYSGSAFDASVSIHYGWNDLPRSTSSLVYSGSTPVGISVYQDWYRTLVTGADASVPAGPVVMRFEGAFLKGRYFSREGFLAPLKKDQTLLMAGLDWSGNSWTITVQAVEDIVFEHKNDLTRDEAETAMTVSLSRTFLRESLEISTFGYLAFTNLDGYASATISYKADDNLELELGTDVFWGGPDNKGTYEGYEELSSLFVKATYRF